MKNGLCSIGLLLYNSHMIPEDIKSFLDHHDLEAIEFEEGSTPTAETAAAKLCVETGQIAKSILMKGKNGSFFLIVCAGDRRVSTSAMKQLTGTKTRMATVEELSEVLDFKPGEVCPFRPESVPVYIDRSLADWELVYPAAGTDSSGVPITYHRLLAVTGGGECDVTG